ncbi:SLATT domain-containing protein [Pollutimonas sp. M17]|uniref:SLATT domain-containing protein n=1 Tax=Pollutimonas sp. M17 TaxID=2962065 RepID=UPI0021F42ED0|nr:SLATT domain-containing protein [Pollutimonas sp. M17]UYO93358.1 SLATT domain-containing protein [Pollutimonas sp. M17]
MKDIQDPSFLAADAPSKQAEPARPRTEAEKLLMRMRISQKCRYNASVRLRRSYRFRLFTSMMFAVGLMIIPLLQNSPIQLGFSASVMAMVQVLLAVGVLVFTVIAGKAGYEIRADRLNQEGDALKEVSRRLTRYMSSNASIHLEDYHHDYARLTSGKESHSRSDYLMARVEMGDEFPMWLGKRVLLRVILSVSAISNYIIPLVLILMEVAFISDMLTLTTFYPGVLHLSAAAH